VVVVGESHVVVPPHSFGVMTRGAHGSVFRNALAAGLTEGLRGLERTHT
jgi:hypothetical protein